MARARRGRGQSDVIGVTYQSSSGKGRILVLGVDGHGVVRRELPDGDSGLLRAVDLDGDGRDELLTCHETGSGPGDST